MAERASPLRSGYDFEVVSPQLTPEDIHRETFGDESGGGLVREAVKGLRRYADARTTNDLATRALDAQLEGNTAQADELLQDRARRAAYSAPDAARVGRASDIGGVGDFVDWFGSTVGEGLPSMGPALLGAAVGRGTLGRVLGGKASAALGAAVPTYQDIRSGEVADQFDDPVLAAAPAEERARVARQTAALGTGLGVMLPARLTGGFSKGGRELLKDIAVETATEGGENLISQYGRRQLDPTRDYDFVEAFDSAAAGGAVGAATGARVRTAQEAISSAKGAYANWSSGRGKPGGAPDGSPGGAPGDAPGGAPAAPSGLFDRVSESFSESGAVVRERAQSVAKSFEDAITDVVGPERAQAFRDRFNSAVGDVGGSISAMKDRLSEFADQEFGPEVADQIRATSEAMSKAGGDLGASASRFADAVKDRASEFDTTELRERMSAGVNKAKDAMSSGLDRMTEAMKTSKSPDEFLRKAFGSTIEEEAAADLDDNNLIGLRGATEAETAANIDRDDAARVERANRYARELMDDPATPDSVRERVASMQGDFSDPSNQKYLSRTLVAMRGGQKVAQAAADLVGLSKYALGAAKKAAGKAVSDVTDAVVKKKNLQSASPAEQAAFNKVIFDNLTEEAKASTFVRGQLSEVTNVLMAFAAKTGDITAKDLPVLTKLANAMSMFKDPDALASQLVEYGAIPRDSDSFLGRVKSIQNARTDIKQPNSFLYTSLTPEAKDLLTGPMLQRLAQLVDEFSIQDAAGKGDQILDGLTQAFGSKESAQAVMDFYAQQNKANVRFDPDEGEDARPMDSDDLTDISAGVDRLTEQDVNALQSTYRAPNTNRPFFRGRDDAALKTAAASKDGGEAGLVASMRDHVLAKQGNAKLAAFDIRRDLQKRLEANVSRDTESVRGAIAALDAHLADAPKSNEWRGLEEARILRDKLRKAKTEDRSAAVKLLREELRAQDDAMEKAKRSGKDPHEALLDLYAVVLKNEDESKASDAQMTKFRELLDKAGKDPKKQALIRRTQVTFEIDGKKTGVSLESMIYNSPAKGSIKERLLASLALVAARADSMPEISPGAVVKRNYYGKDAHLTWGGLMGLKHKIPKVGSRVEYKESPEDTARKAALDGVSASNLRSYLRSLPQDTDALKTSVNLLARVERAQEVLRKEMNAAPSKEAGYEAQQLASKARVLKVFINETLDADYPIDRQTILERLEFEMEEAFDQGGDTAYKDILVAEAQMSALNDRAAAVKGTKLEKKYIDRAEEIADELDRDLSRLQPWQRMNEEDRPSGRPRNSAGAAANAKAMTREQIQKEIADFDAEIARLKAAPLESFRAAAAKDDADSFDSFKKVSINDMNRERAAQIESAEEMKASWEGHLKREAKKKGTGELGAEVEADVVDVTYYGDDGTTTTHQFAKGSRGHKEALEHKRAGVNVSIVEKVQPEGTARQSTMNPKRGRPGKIDRQAVIDEIVRTRGEDVKVVVDKLHSALGGSGQYTYNRKTGRRLIEVAINAIDPIGTARHEAMHDFFQFLGENEATRAVARTLKEVMGSKEVMDKLKDLLQGHKDALEQLNDPEERVAYAYQFWAAGALDLGPKSTGVFRTITNFLRDMFGIVTKEQRAVDILNAFHDGDFSNVSTVREALFDQAARDGATFWEKMDRMAPALNKAILAMSSAAPDRLRRFENDSLNALADKFFTDGGKQGFIQNRFQQEGIWSNKLEAAFAGSTAEERRIALEQLQSMKPVSPLAKKLIEFNSEMYDYMSAAGVKTFDREQRKWVPLRRVNNYFTRSWDGDAIARNRSDFVQLLMSEGGLSLGAAEKVADKLINGREERLTPQEQSILGFTPYAVHTAERVFRFIKPGNADEFAKFQKKDITDIMTNYVQQAVYRAEYARSFDNDGRVIANLITASGITDKDELTAISNTVQAMEGSLDPDKWSSSTKELMSVMMTAQNVILLPLAIVSQVVDPIVLAARTGDLRDAGTAYVNGIKRLWNTVSKNGNKVDGEDLAHILGIVSENSTLQAMGMTASTTRMSKRMEEINRKFFRYNGMQGWNNTMRITATAAAERYITANKDNAEALAELGIKPSDVKMSTVYVPDGKGKLVEKHSLDVSSREVQQAMFKMVDQSVLRPSAANRPVWMSDPRFLLVGHLKQFTFAMHNVVLKRANKQLENGNAKPWLILTLAAPAVLAADMAKFALTGDMPTSWGFFDYLSHAVSRSGLLGIGDFGTELFSGVGQGKLPGEGLLGPSFEHVAEILRWIGGDPRTGFEDVIDRTVPFAKYA